MTALQAAAPRLVLASASTTRRAVLAAAGLHFEAVATGVDEDAIKAAAQAEAVPPADAALMLADAKAERIARRDPDALVIGCDQLLVCEGRWFDKPADRAAALAQLEALQGRAHSLVTSVVAVRDGQRLWHHQEAPRVTLRRLDRAALERYLEAAGDSVLASVGVYHLEGLGPRLMARIEGDAFAIQGLPLLPLLDFLRANGVVR